MLKIAVMGYGTIGSGVVEVIKTNQESIKRKLKEEVEVKYILDLREFKGDPMESKIVHDYKTIAQDDEISVVVETMGGVEPAYTFVKEMLLAKKSVTTSNKALVAEKGAELIALAKENHVNFLFEASVGGGIPILRPMCTSLLADVIEEITGIVNGTTNYMMTKMSEEGLEFDTVLRQAQDKGYAEKDPTADIEGYDACRKIAILTSLACNQQVDYQDIYTQGITHISATDMKYAKKMGCSIKLFAHSKKQNDTYCAMVAPFMVSKEHQLYHVKDVFNAVFVHGNMLGDAMFYGSGAGKLPTASAVVADVIDIGKHKGVDLTAEWSKEKLVLADHKELEHRFFVRTKSSEAKVKEIFEHVDVIKIDENSDEIGFVTPQMKESDYETKMKDVKDVLQMIRMA